MGTGNDRITFRIHKDLLLAKSPFFRASLNEKFLEGQDGSIDLPDDDVLAVKLFIRWLYYDKVDHNDFVAGSSSYLTVYAFADKICTPRYHDTLMDAIRTYHIKTGSFMSASVLCKLYRLGLDHTLLARFGLQTIARVMILDSERWRPGKDLYGSFQKMENNTDVMRDVKMEMIRYRTRPYDNAATLVRCHFHAHDDSKGCTASKG